MSKKPVVVNKRKRAQALADRLKRELGLDECVPLLTADEAERYGRELPDGLFKFYMQKGDISTAVQVSRRCFLARDYSQDEFFNVVTRVWLQHLQTLLGYIVLKANESVEAIEGAV